MKKLFLLLLTATCVFFSCSRNEETPKSTARVAVPSDPSTVDPRLINELNPITIVKGLYEGLMRVDSKGLAAPGIAETVHISDDKLTYTFSLRDAKWSDGSDVTAQDFEYTWKSSLNPNFPSPNAEMLYVIKNAKEAKAGHLPLDSIGVFAPNEKTLTVTLEKPIPYFLELTAFHAFLPINASLDRKNPSWATGKPSEIVTNGPFVLAEWKHNDVTSLRKNNRYWNANDVHLEKIEFIALEENAAMQMFHLGQLDWAGSPMSIIPPDALESLLASNQLDTAPTAGTMLLRFNTTNQLLSHPKIRQALSYAIDRKLIVDHITYGLQTAARGLVPSQLSLQPEGFFADAQNEKAKALFLEGIDELGIVDPPTLQLAYQANERESKIAQVLQQQWESVLPVKIALQSTESKIFFSNVRNFKYDIATGSWFADIRDPINFLEMFATAERSSNRTKWTNDEYTYLIEKIYSEDDSERRKKLMLEAEALLMAEMPIAPLFFFNFNYLKNPALEGVYLSDLGYLDFVKASKG